MKIAILTLRVDNNYGGHLQRYALSRVLRDMGHEVSVLYFRSTWLHDSAKRKIKVAAKNFIKVILGRTHNPVLYWKHEDYQWEEIRAHAYPFFERYVPHSPLLYDEESLKKHVNCTQYDCFIVGSDQVWRKAYTQRWGVEHFFLDFVPRGTKKIAYAASFGLPDMEYEEDEIKRLHALYKLFDAVSVREESGLDVLAMHGWTDPKAKVVLDPTMLLPKEHYQELIKDGNTVSSKGNMFCYVLDENEEIKAKIEQLAKEKDMKPFYASIFGEQRMSVEQWLRSFDDAEYVVTNSYHGIVFALIFNKPFYLIQNADRGNARFASLMNMFGLKEDNSAIVWNKVNSKMAEMREISINYLKESLKK